MSLSCPLSPTCRFKYFSNDSYLHSIFKILKYFSSSRQILNSIETVEINYFLRNFQATSGEEIARKRNCTIAETQMIDSPVILKLCHGLQNVDEQSRYFVLRITETKAIIDNCHLTSPPKLVQSPRPLLNPANLDLLP